MQNKSVYLWGLVGRVAPQLIYLLTTMVLARFLSPNDFGEIGVLSVIFLVANVLLDSGLGGSLVKEKYISEIDCSSIFIFNMFVSLTIYIILFVSAGNIESYFAIDGLKWVIRTISVVFPFSAFGIVPKALLNRGLYFKVSCYNAVLGVVVASVCSITSAFCEAGVYALVIYQVVCVMVTSLANYVVSTYHFSFHFSWDSLKRLIPFGVTTTFITIIDTIYENLMTIMTGKFLNVQQAGFLYQAKRVEDSLSTSLATTIGTVAFPVLTRFKDDKKKFVDEADSTFMTISAISIPLMMVVATFSKEIIIFLFGKQWIEAGFYLKLLAFAGIFLIMETLIRNFIKALCEVKKLFYATITKRVTGLLLIIGAFMLSPSYMVYAYILSTIIGYLINVVLYSMLVNVNIRSRMRQCLIVLYPGFLFYIVVNIFCFEQLFVKSIISILMLIIIYIVLLPLQGINTLGCVRSFLQKNE